MELDHVYVKTNGITLHVAQAGPVDGPPVILLHGFPEYWGAWKRQIPALAAAGYRVWAPDQRGYNLSDKPPEIADYRTEPLVNDILGLIEATGSDTVRLTGHDWGGNVAWNVALRAPERLHHLVILNVPHPRVMARHLRSDWRQRGRSSYMFAFQIPWLPEALAGSFNSNLAVRAMKATSAPGTFTPADIAGLKKAWSQPGAFQSMLNWYRAAFRFSSEDRPEPEVIPPTTIIWGDNDVAFEAIMAEESVALCRDGTLHKLEGVSHWVQHEAPERVNTLLLEAFSHKA